MSRPAYQDVLGKVTKTDLISKFLFQRFCLFLYTLLGQQACDSGGGSGSGLGAVLCCDSCVVAVLLCCVVLCCGSGSDVGSGSCFMSVVFCSGSCVVLYCVVLW